MTEKVEEMRLDRLRDELVYWRVEVERLTALIPSDPANDDCVVVLRSGLEAFGQCAKKGYEALKKLEAARSEVRRNQERAEKAEGRAAEMYDLAASHRQSWQAAKDKLKAARDALLAHVADEESCDPTAGDFHPVEELSGHDYKVCMAETCKCFGLCAAIKASE